MPNGLLLYFVGKFVIILLSQSALVNFTKVVETAIQERTFRTEYDNKTLCTRLVKNSKFFLVRVFREICLHY